MTKTIYEDGLAANTIALRHTLTEAMVDATTACKDLEIGNRTTVSMAITHHSATSSVDNSDG